MSGSVTVLFIPPAEEVSQCCTPVAAALTPGGDEQEPDQGSVHTGEGPAEEPWLPGVMAGGCPCGEPGRPKEHCPECHG